MNMSLDLVQSLNRAFAATEARLVAQADAARVQADELAVTIEHLEQRLVALQDEAASLRTSVADLRAGAVDKDMRLGMLTAEIAQADALLSDLEGQLREATQRQSDAEKERGDALRQAQEGRARIDELHARLALREADLTSRSARLTACEATLFAQQRDLQVCRESEAAARARAAEAEQAQIDLRGRLADLDAVRATIEASGQAARAEALGLSEALDAAHAALAQSRDRISSLEAELRLQAERLDDHARANDRLIVRQQHLEALVELQTTTLGDTSHRQNELALALMAAQGRAAKLQSRLAQEAAMRRSLEDRLATRNAELADSAEQAQRLTAEVARLEQARTERQDSPQDLSCQGAGPPETPPRDEAAPSNLGLDPGNASPSHLQTDMNDMLMPDAAATVATPDLAQLLARHDTAFVEAAYRAILKRPPDPSGREHYLQRLRSGEAKLQLLLDLSQSEESRRRGGDALPGLHAASRRLRLARLPIVGRLLRALVGSESSDETQKRLRAMEQQLARATAEESARVDKLQRSMAELLDPSRTIGLPDGRRRVAAARRRAPAFFTICSKNFTAYARTLYESLTSHHPGAEFYMFLCDGPDPRFDPATLPFKVVPLTSLDIPDVEGMAQRYNITEFNTAIKPFAFRYLFKVRDAKEVVYLDPDILVTSPLEEVLDALNEGADCVLTPHILNPAEGAEVSDDKMLLFGIYNLGFLALRQTPRVLQIVEWWGRRLERECIIALEKGLFVDQKWADLFPAYIPNTFVLRHAGYNVAYWNVPQRSIARRNGIWMANDEPLRFAHFSGNKLDDPSVYSRHSWTLNTSNIGDLKDLLDQYRQAVYVNGHAEYSKLPYAYNWNGEAGVNLHTPKPAVDEGEPPPATPIAVVPPPRATSPEGNDVAASDRPGRPLPKVFVTDWSTPRPDQDAGSVTTYFFLKVLVNLGYDVTFVPSDLEPLGDYTAAVRALGVRCLTRENIGSVNELLVREGTSFDACVLFRAPIAALYLADIRRLAPQAKVVLETVDLHYLRDERAAQADGSPEAIDNARKAKDWELGIIRDCDVSIVLSSYEQELVERELPAADIRTMPLLFLDMPGPSALTFGQRADMLFIGGFRHLPNVDAVQWFCRDIWPQVHARLPEARFLIVGSHPPPEVLELDQVPGVQVMGHVKDLDPIFGRVRLSVTPLRFGAGIKGKVATSLGYGVPVVGTALTFEGMELRHEKHVLVADEVDDFVEQIVRGYTDEALWNRLSRDGFERVNDLYSEHAGLVRVQELMDSLQVKSSDFTFATLRSHGQYVQHHRVHASEYERRQRLELSLIERGVDSFVMPGYCAVCRCRSEFQVSFMYSYQSTPDGLPIPNWREHLNCLRCGHTTRVRLMLQLIEQYIRPPAQARIYISEQTTPMFKHLSGLYPGVQGSEYLGDRVAPGATWEGLRNEDLTRLTYPDGCFDLMISCDVLEHVTDERAAFAECFRCLAPGGRVLFTAPTSLDSASNIVRARIDAGGRIEHLITPPEYHGNPVDPENGALCFRYFGWEVLDQLRAAGFADAYALSVWSRDLAYLGVEQIAFVAVKAP